MTIDTMKLMFTADQIVAHLVGDYSLQSHWMATEKIKQSLAAALHAIFYTLPFLFLTQSPEALAVICGSHFVIDRWRLARYVIWLKNWIALPSLYAKETISPLAGKHLRYGLEWDNKPWAECSKTGYPDDTPPWLSVWLLIIADNTLHLICNAAALKWL